MITGDALLTGVHVASEVNIVKKARVVTLTQDNDGALFWSFPDGNREPYNVAGISALARKNDLCLDGDLLEAAAAIDKNIWAHMRQIRVSLTAIFFVPLIPFLGLRRCLRA